jgi:hypothetical protein
VLGLDRVACAVNHRAARLGIDRNAAQALRNGRRRFGLLASLRADEPAQDLNLAISMGLYPIGRGN